MTVASNPVTPVNCIQFGDDFELDLRAYELRSAGIPIKLKPIPMELLLFLVQRRGELVTREQIVERIWGKGVFLDTDNSINGAISKIRQVLRDNAEQPRFVQTVSGRGYRFIAPVVETRPPVVGPTTAIAGESLLGKKVSHYRILQLLGGGGMGVVYKAEDLKLGRQVALKFLPGELASDPVAYERLQREARAASSLDHPNICSIYQLGEHEGQPFIVMQLLEGRTLREWIDSIVHPAPAERMSELFDLAIQIADGLDAAHQKGIIHRDIKPANIFVTTRGHVKILDFGVAKFIDAADLTESKGAAPPSAENENRNTNLHLTRTGISVGTPSYLSPEQIRREKLDERTDLFSFGLVLYEMATGRRAFLGNTTTIIRDGVLNLPAMPAQQIAPEVPAELERIIDKSLQKDRELRYQSARGCREDLERARLAGAKTEAAISPAANSGLVGPRRGNLRWILSIASVAVVVALVFGFLQRRSVHASRLTENDSIVLADFANSTGDSVFDGSLKQGLSIALGQSPFLNIISDRKVRSTLKLMTQPTDAPLTNELAQEVCQRTGSKAYVAGTIAAVGSSFVIGLRAENCQNGEILAQQQITAKAKEDVIPALGTAASRLRSALGESISSVQKLDVPLREATTSSMDALKEYTLGGQAGNVTGSSAAIEHYQRAIALDPLFARAYSSLSGMYFDAGESSLAAKAATKAYELRSHGTDLEQIQIAASYHAFTTGDLEKAAADYERWREIRPRSPLPHANLSYVFTQIGQSEKALAESLEALRLGPSGVQYTNLVSSYIVLGRLKEAKATVDESRTQNMDLPINHNNVYLIAFLEHDRPTMEREAAWALGKPELEGILFYSQACTSAYFGELKESRETVKRASNSAIAGDLKEAAATYRADGAIHQALYGNAQEAERALRTVPIAASGQEVQAAAAMAYAFAGDRARAQGLADSIAKQYPENTLVQFNYLPVVRAQIALNSKNPNHAIELLKDARRYELGQPAQVISLNMYPTFVRGEAYLAIHDGAAALAEFQKILDNPGVSINEPIAALAHLGLARATALKGEKDHARSLYQDFIGLWKDADPAIPILKQAKSEYAALQSHH
jgi:serine/threonine protein kinase/tetratricopeptide (TPR) repeat protein